MGTIAIGGLLLTALAGCALLTVATQVRVAATINRFDDPGIGKP